MSSTSSKLFQPAKFANITLQHRVVMAPLTRFRANKRHAHTELGVEYYSQRASVPGTLIIVRIPSSFFVLLGRYQVVVLMHVCTLLWIADRGYLYRPSGRWIRSHPRHLVGGADRSMEAGSLNLLVPLFHATVWSFSDAKIADLVNRSPMPSTPKAVT